jgi:hypothetical protein
MPYDFYYLIKCLNYNGPDMKMLNGENLVPRCTAGGHHELSLQVVTGNLADVILHW